jgi:sterol 14-demethylase
MDSGTTPATVILPWFPGPGMISKLLATKGIYDIIISAIDARKQGGIAKNDTLQKLIDAGDDRMMILGVCGALHIRWSQHLYRRTVHHGPFHGRS